LARSTDESRRGILRDLRWLNLFWDEGPDLEDEGAFGPYLQSQRLEIYTRYFDQLTASGHAYQAWETREELNAMRKAAREASGNFRYRRIPYSDEQIAQFKAEGRIPVLRLKNPEHDFEIQDDVLGPVTIAKDDLDDIVIRKADGFPTYHFAVVIDDFHMRITHVLRGQEHLMNTPKHLGLYEALSWSPPRFGHLPLIFNPEGTKMGKRDKAKAARAAARREQQNRAAQGQSEAGWDWLAAAIGVPTEDVKAFMKKKSDSVGIAEQIASHLGVDLPMIDVMDFRKGGFIPEALVNYLALLGWSPGDDRELMSMEEMCDLFTIERVGKTAARFDVDKLRWMNGEYMRSLSLDALTARLEEYLEVVDSPLRNVDVAFRIRWLELMRKRAPTFKAMENASGFFFARPSGYDKKAVKKHLLKGDGLANLATLRSGLASILEWNESSIEEAFQAIVEHQGLGLGKLAQPARVAVSGSSVTPPIYETLAFMDHRDVIDRFDQCLKADHATVGGPV